MSIQRRPRQANLEYQVGRHSFLHREHLELTTFKHETKSDYDHKMIKGRAEERKKIRNYSGISEENK